MRLIGVATDQGKPIRTLQSVEVGPYLEAYLEEKFGERSRELWEDIRQRLINGEKKYGMALTTDNGRSALMDAYQGTLDAVVYMEQELLEETQLSTPLDDLILCAISIRGMILGKLDRINEQMRALELVCPPQKVEVKPVSDRSYERVVIGGVGEATVGDVIQIHPVTRLKDFHYRFATVDEVKQWGVVAYVHEREGLAYVRLTWGQFVCIGKASYMVGTEETDGWVSDTV